MFAEIAFKDRFLHPGPDPLEDFDCPITIPIIADIEGYNIEHGLAPEQQDYRGTLNGLYSIPSFSRESANRRHWL